MLKRKGRKGARSFSDQPPSGGCVLKPDGSSSSKTTEKPAAFRRLCVETLDELEKEKARLASRLQAAVC